MARVAHFEINADDRERAVKFYQDVFGWEITV
jgi:predicted enzyme related to lactoylglutathione lyase